MKDKIKTVIYIFSLIVTAIFLIDSVFLYIFKGKQAVLSAVDIMFILLDAFICAVCYLPLLSDKGISKMKMFFLQIGYAFTVNIIVLVTGHFLNWFSFKNPASFFEFEAVILFSYILAFFTAYKIDSGTADKMNEKLKQINEKDE
ncbi:MAG: hypothetical protein K6E51_01655 [Treponema sp.]|nr:hypothetical protein [Treponema sp.]